jgi:hypothetical protein
MRDWPAEAGDPKSEEDEQDLKERTLLLVLNAFGRVPGPVPVLRMDVVAGVAGFHRNISNAFWEGSGDRLARLYDSRRQARFRR